MTDFDMRCGEKAVREYVRLAMTGSTIRQSLPLIICASCLTAMPVLGVIGFIMTNSPLMLALTGGALLLAAGIVVFLKITVNSTAKKLLQAFREREGLVCSVSEKNILIVRDNRPIRVVGWDAITDISEGKYAFFLKEGDTGLIILDKANVLSGTVEETTELLSGKLEKSK